MHKCREERLEIHPTDRWGRTPLECARMSRDSASDDSTVSKYEAVLALLEQPTAPTGELSSLELSLTVRRQQN